MTFAKRIPQIDWRPFLTSDEAENLSRLEDEAGKLDAARRALTPQITVIRNRCMQRAILARKRQAA